MNSRIPRALPAVAIGLSLSAGVMADEPGPCPPLANDSPLTLATAISYGICQNPDTRSVWAQLAVQQAAVAISDDANKPSLSLQASTTGAITDDGHNTTSAVQARLSYLLFDFGQRQAEQQQARALAQAAQQSLDVTTAGLSRDIISAYVAVLKAQAQIDAASQALLAANNSLTSAEARYKAGVGTPLDVLQAKAAAAQAQLTLVQARSQLAGSRGELALVMGLRPTLLPALAQVGNVELTLPFGVDALEQMPKQAQSQRAEVKVAEANVSAADQAIEAARSATRPTLNLSASAGVQQGEADRQTTGSIGLTLSAPFDIGGGQKARIRQSQAQKNVRMAALAKSRQSIEQEVWQAFYRAQAAIEAVKAAQDALDSSERASQVALGRYQAGVGAMLEVLMAQSQFARSQQQLAAARYDWLDARIALAYALGQQLLPVISTAAATGSIAP